MITAMAFHEILDLFNTRSQPWRADAACRGMDPAIFFPAGNEPLGEALAVCRRCPVQAQCAEWGIGHELTGIWGGMSERQRARARRASGLGLVELRGDPDELYNSPPDSVADPLEVA